MSNPKLITPCPVCGLEQECPHTPVRCQHEWNYSPFDAEVGVTVGTQRTCPHCDRIERATIKWATVKA